MTEESPSKPGGTREKIELLPDLKGFIKVRLRYSTQIPRHLRSYILKTTYNIEAPYFEEVYILMPQSKVFPLLEAFLPAFNRVKEHLDKSAVLKDFKIVDEDTQTLAYKVE